MTSPRSDPLPAPQRSRAATSGSLAALLSPPSPLIDLAERFSAADHELYLVGGSVRDAYLGRRPGRDTDLDLSTDATPDQVQEITRPVARTMWLQGVRFGTVGAEVGGRHLEITTFRTERYQPSSRHPEVVFAADVTTDLSRRDFTINAMAVRLPDLGPVDSFGGRVDLDTRLLRTPGDPEDSFTDDPLRMLRAFRFASELEFQIDEGVLEAVARLKNEIKTVSAERIRDELSKLLLGAAPAKALEQAEATGLTQLFLPELSSLKLEQDPVHRHKDVFTHTLAVIERTPAVETLRLAALLHDIGKPKTRRISGKGVSFHHHEIVGAQMAEARLRRAPLSERDRGGSAGVDSAPPSLSHLSIGVEGFRSAPLRARRRPAPGAPQRPRARRLHHAQCGQGKGAVGPDR